MRNKKIHKKNSYIKVENNLIINTKLKKLFLKVEYADKKINYNLQKLSLEFIKINNKIIKVMYLYKLNYIKL